MEDRLRQYALQRWLEMVLFGAILNKKHKKFAIDRSNVVSKIEVRN